MNQHFRAFSFVDRILSVDAGVNISSTYAIPGDLPCFPILLVAEAIGQSAAWSAMAALDFQYRPVAGLTAKVEVFSLVRSGQILELSAELESVDSEAVAYSGTAKAGGVTIARLEHSVGPMMPMEEFDDPAALRDRYALLRNAGAVPGAFRGLPSLPVEITAHEKGVRKSASLQIPASAPFFADHFPRRPVFPGTLLMGLNLDLANSLAQDVPPPDHKKAWQLRSTRDAKFRSFTPPGASLQCEVKLEGQSDSELAMAIQTRDASNRVVASAKALFQAPENS